MKIFTSLLLFLITQLNSSTPHSISTPHGSFYGFNKIDPESYVYQNYYRTPASGPSSYLTNALFYGDEIRFGNTMHDIESYIPWNDEKDEEWRATTKSPYFENKIPQSEDVLSAAVVDVAATAFGLRSLLPLNVPPRMPLIYCKRSEYQMKQATIELDGEIYFCRRDKFVISCSAAAVRVNGHVECLSSSSKLFFSDGALRSNLNIFCNATRSTSSKMGKVLECYYGKLKSEVASFIPTKEPMAMSSTTSDEKTSSLSFASEMHKFLMKMIGKYDEEGVKVWKAEALVIPRIPGRKKPGRNF